MILTMKVCLIGNSHSAALANSWSDVTGEWADIEVTFFGTLARLYLKLVYVDQQKLSVSPQVMLASTTDGVKSRPSEIDLAQFDAVVVVGCGFGPSCVFRAYRDYSYYTLKARRPVSVTRDQFLYAVRGYIAESPAHYIATLARRHSSLPVLLVPAPLPSEGGLGDDAKPILLAYSDARQNDDGDELMAVYADACAELHDQGMVVVEQPKETKADTLFTKRCFSEGSSRLMGRDFRHGAEDVFHMNEAYGRLMWRQILGTATRLVAESPGDSDTENPYAYVHPLDEAGKKL